VLLRMAEMREDKPTRLRLLGVFHAARAFDPIRRSDSCNW
jgi:hypothetical protein